ncbi:SIMPL domain-containing protein [Ketogulonicigenium vulgare]|uniref:SIMPL domain-containing protein n=1 Tax=Ketogulonicigenium vulgare TaxID=92945 RepID=UPI0023582836|nr:SIMPL domain-containing protein [Ketogulonicigenium vulgare]
MNHSISALATAAVLAIAAPAFADETMTVTGTGQVMLAPDMAHVSVGVSFDADTAAEAMAGMSTDLSAVMARVEAAGIEARDVQTSSIELNPRYDYPENSAPVLVGFTAASNLQLRVRDLDALGSVLDATVSDGANRVSGISFDVQDPAAAMNDARRAAVADAVAKANLFADAAGVRLGDLQNLTEQYAPVRPMPIAEGRMMAMAADSVPVAGGELTLSTSVTLVYEIKQ